MLIVLKELWAILTFAGVSGFYRLVSFDASEKKELRTSGTILFVSNRVARSI